MAIVTIHRSPRELRTLRGTDQAGWGEAATNPNALQAVPQYSSGSTDHVLHWYENFNGYTDFTPSGAVGTNPDRVGPAMNVGSAVSSTQIGLLAIDDGLGGSGQAVHVDTSTNNTQGGRDISVNTGAFANQGSVRRQLIWEATLRERGTDLFQGKFIDWSNSAQTPTGWRWDFNNGSATFNHGEEPAATCALNHLCQRYYSGPDTNPTPLISGIPPNNGYQGGVVRYRQLASRRAWCLNGDPPLGIDGRGTGCGAASPNNPSDSWNYYQNRNWGTGSGAWDLMQNRFANGSQGSLPHVPFIKLVWALTISTSNNAGNGRWESWVQQGSDQSALKVVEFIGDASVPSTGSLLSYDPGLAFTFRTGTSPFGGALHYGGPLFGPPFPAPANYDLRIEWSQFRCWSRTPPPVS